jgi:hypothetical protein
MIEKNSADIAPTTTVKSNSKYSVQRGETYGMHALICCHTKNGGTGKVVVVVTLLARVECFRRS